MIKLNLIYIHMTGIKVITKPFRFFRVGYVPALKIFLETYPSGINRNGGGTKQGLIFIEAKERYNGS